MAKGITAKPTNGLGNDIRSFVDDISVNTHSKRIYDPVTKKLCIVKVSRDMAIKLARGIAELRGKVSPKTTIVGTCLKQTLLLREEFKNARDQH